VAQGLTPACWSVLLVLAVLGAATLESARDVHERDLEASSAGRTVRVRLSHTGIVELPLELYVARVLAGEGEPRAGDSAQQALAITIRTFAAANSSRHRRNGYDLCDTTHCQVLRPSTPASRLAAFATASQVLTYEGRPAQVFYSASCGGRSEAPSQVWSGAADPPYLRSAGDDAHSADEQWQVEIGADRIEQALRRIGFAGRHLRDLRVERRTPSGRAAVLQVTGFRPDVIRGEDFRAAIGARELRSTHFAVSSQGSTFRFTGRGYGHGVGMCVRGASRRAARGDTAEAILQQYYPGARIEHARTAAVAPAAPTGSMAHDVARRARTELAARLGLSPAPLVRVELYESAEAFRAATGRPWWMTFAVNRQAIELAPYALLEQSPDGPENVVRRAVAEALTAEALAGRPAWVRVGAGRYYARKAGTEGASRPVACPSDAELVLAVSAASYRDAEMRAETCFARAIAKQPNWRKVG
jgi:stage II sporulation protein D